MTISTSTSRVVFQGDASNDTFTYSFLIPTATDVIATFTDSDGTETVLTTAQYTITGLDDPDGGTIQYPLSGTVMAVGETLTLERDVPYTQEVVLSNQGAYYPSVVEGALDALEMQIQQVNDVGQRSIRASAVDSNPTMLLPAAAVRAGGYLAFDSAGSVAIVSASGGVVVWQSSLLTSGGTMTGPINETMDTVASHATTADIWSAGNVINWTGTETTTAFPNAPVAGARRLLVCAGACSFTAGANLLIRGVVSGGTITLAANDHVLVLAKTTTQFQLDFDKSDSLPEVTSHATTGDIWSPGEVISWTGTATTTAFPNAPKAGTRRTLICAGACSFTTGANLLIKGIASGVTVTMKANAKVEVVALTTSQFQLEYSLSGSFTATGTGFTSAPTKTWFYTVNNGEVSISTHGQDFNGVSNTTAFTITGFPAEITPPGNRYLAGLLMQDNAADFSTGLGILAATGVLSLFTTYGGGVWTASSTKAFHAGEFSYQL